MRQPGADGVTVIIAGELDASAAVKNRNSPSADPRQACADNPERLAGTAGTELEHGAR
jgi:hypothetical protein